MAEGGSRGGMSLSLKRLTAEGHEGGILGTLGCERKGLGTGICLHGDSVGQPGVVSSTGDFEIRLKGALELGSLSLSLFLSLWELCEGNLEGWLPCWVPWRTGRTGSGEGHLFP